MHLLVREARGLDEDAPAIELAHDPADLVILSFSDSDLGAAAAAWDTLPAPRPSLRLAQLGQLRHPMSVDLYADRVIAHARCVIVRLLGGMDYWRYGVEELVRICAAAGIPLALLPGCDRDDPRLPASSSIAAPSWQRLRDGFRQGGPENMRGVLRLAGHLAGLNQDDAPPPARVPAAGIHSLPESATQIVTPWATGVIVFYRSHLLSGDTAPVEAMAAALGARGIAARALYVSSLKDEEAARFVADDLRARRPDVVLNMTAFSARGEAGSPLDAADAPVLQLVLCGAARDGWAASPRGLSPADLAMHVVLPELDGRLMTTAIAFKAEHDVIPALQFTRSRNQPDRDGVALAADRAAGWARLATTPPARRRLAIVLSDYPGASGDAGQAGHAVGLDSFASLDAIVALLRTAGYEIGSPCAPPPDWVTALCHAPASVVMTADDYRARFATLPPVLRAAVVARWGDPAGRSAPFRLRHWRGGGLLVAVQPDRNDGAGGDRRQSYHDPDQPPGHDFIAFHFMLRDHGHALVHLGTHGSLEWLPGKSVALSAACAPAALLGGLPVIYPFIVNNPGEAAAAKRRLGAVTIGHLTPPLHAAGAHGAAAELERLIDEYAAADGMDRRRMALLRRDILDRAEASGLIVESGGAHQPEAEQLARLDAYLCDVKELQIRDGLHVFAQAPRGRDALLDALRRACPDTDPARLADRLDASAPAEGAALLAALDGRFVPPGPAGAPTRGRADVLPTGRNLFTTDPRAIPTRSAMILAHKAAAELQRRHRQDQGEPLRRLVIDLWGSATMRTGGEDLALALVLMGAQPCWDSGSNRVNGFEVLPVARLDHPRVDVTLRVSGLFRDAFEAQIALFDAVVRAVAARDEAGDWNPLAAACQGLDGTALRQATTRVYGAAPGSYGAGNLATSRADIGRGYLAASAACYGHGLDGRADPFGFAARVRDADAFLHSQDHPETDLLDSPDYALHEGGFAAAALLLGGRPALYHADTSKPDQPRLRGLTEEIARVVRGRASNPRWIAGMMRHGYRGAAEIAQALAGLHAFALAVPHRFDPQFSQIFDATFGTESVRHFLQQENPAAFRAMRDRFRAARDEGLWHGRRNSVAALLDDAA